MNCSKKIQIVQYMNGGRNVKWNSTLLYAVMELGKGNIRVKGNYHLQSKQMSKKTTEKGLGVIIQDDLSPRQHIKRIT